MKILRLWILLVLSVSAGLAAAEKTVLRVGYFPNVTHAQGVIGSHGVEGGSEAAQFLGTGFRQRLGTLAAPDGFG